MSQFLLRRYVPQVDPLTEHLANLQPEQVDALQMMRNVYSNQVVLSAAVVSLQRHLIDVDSNVFELADSVAANTLPRLEAISKELE